MKKKIIFLGTVIFGFMAQSCEDFLVEDVRADLATTNFYETAEDAMSATWSVYQPLDQIYERRIMLLNALPADDMKNGVGMGNGNLQDLEFARHTAENQWTRDIWRRHYGGIANANTALENIPNVSMDAGLKAELIGEVKFLRALYYFNLVRWFGEIPLTTSTVTSLEEAIIPQAPVSEVYDLIIRDLKDAEAVLPFSYPVGGRATRGAAKILLGKVYLTMGEYQDCVDKLAEVIENEGEYGYGLHDYYGDNWEIETELGQEMVFTLEMMDQPSNAGNVAMRLMGPRNGNALEDPEAQLGLDRRGDEADLVTMDLYSIFQEEDTRREETLTYRFPSLISDSVYIAQYPLGVKYWEEGEAFNANSDANMHILRYADALLMYAEALNEVDQTPTALVHLNHVRDRAFQDTEHSFPAGMSQTQFRDSVLLERRRELALEGHRWFDLVRTGRLIETMKAHSILEAELAGEPVRLQIGENIGLHMVLMPIPQVEINVNDKLTQNGGY